MNNARLSSPLPEWLAGVESTDWHELSDRYAACLVLSDLDFESQLAAIHHALRRHRHADEELKQEIAEIEALAQRTSGIRNERAVDEWVDRLHLSVYEDAARSMAAVGMLAPLMESVFYQVFQGIRQASRQDVVHDGKHPRWSQPAEDQWDCHFVWSNGRRRTNLVGGIGQLATATGLEKHLPQGLDYTLQALFEYRNKMFHYGFEWPVAERDRFARRVAESGWPSTWFTRAQREDKPWIFYMSEAFIEHVVKTIDDVVEAIGAYCRDRFFAKEDGKESAR